MIIKTRPRSLLFLLLASLLFSLIASPVAQGELLFSDSFLYPAGPLAGQGPPEGAPAGQTGWTLVEGEPSVMAGLRFKDVFSEGGAANLLGRRFDTAVAYLNRVTSGVVWLGFLMDLHGGDDLGFAVINLSYSSSLPPGYGVLFNARVFGIDNGDGRPGSQVFSTLSPSRRTTWLVVMLDFDTGRQVLYLNPPGSLSSLEGIQTSVALPMTREFQSEGFDHLALHVGSNNGQWRFDEVRIGTSFEDVQMGDPAVR